MKKYKLIKNDSIGIFGHKLYRIMALRSFGDVKKGELGGYIETESNLSQEGNCWIYDNAKVYKNTRVCGEAKVYGNAMVYGNAKIYGNSEIYENVIVCDDAKIYGNAMVYGEAMICENAKIYGNARVYGNTMVCGNSRVYGRAKVCGNAKVYGNAIICGNSMIYGKARVYGKAKIGEYMHIRDVNIDKDLTKDKKLSFAAQIGFYPEKEFILYKRVKKIKKGLYQSLFDKNFIYKDGKWAKVDKPDMSNVPCSSGIHLSTLFYWDDGDTIIKCLVRWKDVITIQEGKVRVKKCKVLGELKIRGDLK